MSLPPLAYFSPLPPARTGVADYSAELLPELAEHFAIDVDDGSAPERKPAPGTGAITVYQLGNNADFHASIYRRALERPGVVVLHEVVLHHMIREMTLARGDVASYLGEVEYSCGRVAREIALRALNLGVPLDPWRFPLFERVVDASTGVLVHSEHARTRILASRPAARVHVVPFAARTPPPSAARTDLRRALGLEDGDFVVGVFGFMTRAKRLEVVLAALEELVPRVPRVRLVVVGEVAKNLGASEPLSPQVGARVRFLGRVEAPAFADWLYAVDAAVNLRHPSAGETSSTLVRLLQAGVPTIVSRGGSFDEIPESCAVHVERDGAEVAVLAALLELLAQRPEVRAQLSANARAFGLRFSPSATAGAYAEVLAEWTKLRAVAPRGASPRGGLTGQILPDLLASIGRDFVDLGRDERSADELRSLAGLISGAGLTAVRR